LLAKRQRAIGENQEFPVSHVTIYFDYKAMRKYNRLIFYERPSVRRKKTEKNENPIDRERCFQYIRRSLLVTDDAHHGAIKQE
jgi:hypothetical protein